MKNKKRRQVLRVSGTLLVVLGVTLLVVGWVGLVLAFPPCSIYGCPSIFSGYYAVFWSEIFAGLVIIAVGLGLILQARRIEGGLAEQHSTSATSSSPAPGVSRIFVVQMT